MKLKSCFLIFLFLFYSANGGACELWDKIQEDGILVVGMDSNYPPFESLNEKGELVGFDIELVRMLAMEMGLEVKFKILRFDEIFSEILAGDIDLAVSCISRTEERKKTYAFSRPYYRSAQMVIVDSKSKLYKMEELSGKLVYAQRGTTSAEMAEKITGAKVRLVDDFTNVLSLMDRGEQVAIVADRTLAEHYRRERGALTLGSPLSYEDIAMMMAKDCPVLQSSVNKALVSLSKRGEVRRLREKWNL